MSLLFTILNSLVHDTQATVYFAQSVTYGLAFWATHRGGHAPWQVYLASCVFHFTLGLLHC